MSLVEVMVSLFVITVATYILTYTIMASVAHTGSKREKNLAVEAATNVIERLRACPPQDIFALYNDTPIDDPYGAGTGPGSTFLVAGLDPQKNARGQDLPVGQVLMPGNGAVLNESVVDARFGLPRDLDGSMFIEDDDCADRYIFLPLTIRVQWNGKLGNRHIEMSTVIVDVQRLQP
ncbi:hypothetical protein Poly30_26380 [Planctomycetes bacterium Poly30]|uniref:Uncharacterized protein n=2 Tax=Saltatorellus ferox TaxID=2528018 RepID=A0A518ESQ1_9BACT|nr:hypothetical protein Poly30_26380 [Planctomycetes bacterium Poly30]